MPYAGAFAGGLRNPDLFQHASLVLDFAGSRSQGQPYYRQNRQRRRRMEAIDGATYTGGAGFKLDQRSDGLWLPAAANVITRTDQGFGSWEARTNSIRNPTGLGAVAGTLGSGGALPTNWSVQTQGGVGLPTSGLACDVSAPVTENGIHCVDIRIYGTPTDSLGIRIFFEAATQIAWATGATIAQSFFAKLKAGALAGSAAIQALERSGAGSFLAGQSSAIALTSTLTPFHTAFTAAQATTAFGQPDMVLPYTSGVPLDVTIRLGAPNWKAGADIADPPIQQTNNLAATRTTDALSFKYQMPAEGIVFVEYVAPSVVVSAANRRTLWSIADSGNSRLACRGGDTGGGAEPIGVIGDGVSNVNLTPAVTTTPGQVVRCAIAYSTRQTLAGISVNGATPVTVAKQLDPATIAGVSTMYVGNSESLGNPLCSTIRCFAIFPFFDAGNVLKGLTA